MYALSSLRPVGRRLPGRKIIRKEVIKMATIDLSKYGITGTTEILHNPSYETLFEEEMKPGLEGYDVGQLTELDAVNVMTGIYTGRSPKDKFIVMDDVSKDTVWWTSDEFKNDNKPASKAAWDECKRLAVQQLSNKKLYVMDVFCGTNHDSRMAIRFIMEVAMAGPLRKEYVHRSHRGGAGELRARFHLLQCRQGEGGELQGAGPEL